MVSGDHQRRGEEYARYAKRTPAFFPRFGGAAREKVA